MRASSRNMRTKSGLSDWCGRMRLSTTSFSKPSMPAWRARKTSAMPPDGELLQQGVAAREGDRHRASSSTKWEISVSASGAVGVAGNDVEAPLQHQPPREGQPRLQRQHLVGVDHVVVHRADDERRAADVRLGLRGRGPASAKRSSTREQRVAREHGAPGAHLVRLDVGALLEIHARCTSSPGSQRSRSQQARVAGPRAAAPAPSTPARAPAPRYRAASTIASRPPIDRPDHRHRAARPGATRSASVAAPEPLAHARRRASPRAWCRDRAAGDRPRARRAPPAPRRPGAAPRGCR